MHLSSTIAAGAALVSGASATNWLGFNSGATLADRSAKFKSDFAAEFKTAQALSGAPGKFNAVRLYTNIQAYSKDDPIEAFEAAIDTKTHILLGAWASGTDNIDKELTALTKAIEKHGEKFTDLVIGMSVGSEDLYRNSEMGVKNKGGIGNSADAIVSFISDYRKAVAKTPLAKLPVGHVDTWDAWTNGTNSKVIDAVDFIGVDEYPFYEASSKEEGRNVITNSGILFDQAYDAVIGASKGKPVWVTETGWPVSGPDWEEAEPSVKNAKYFWNEVGCRRLFNKTPTFWYNLRDSNPDNEVKFAITENLKTTPLFDLSCPTKFETPEKSKSSSSSPSGTASSSDGSSTKTDNVSPTSSPGSGSGSGSGSVTTTGGSATKTPGSDSGVASVKTGVVYIGMTLIAGLWMLL